MEPVRVGVVGCGDIAPTYLHSLRRFPQVRCVRVADVSRTRAEALGGRWQVPVSADPDRLLADPEVELVLNLTPPHAHYATALAAIQAGKHVYNEKPLAATPALGRRLLAAGRSAGVRVGCAPATWMGGTWQAGRSLVDAGVLGRPVGAHLVFLDRGYESWHPRPRSYYRAGAGPLLDMGPYYVAALVLLLGPVARVTGLAATVFPERVIGTGPRRGTRFRIGTTDHVAGVLQLASNVIATITTSYAAAPVSGQHVQLFGSEATMLLPPANHLGGPIWIQGSEEPRWQRLPVRHGRTGQRSWWGVGLADLAGAIRDGGPHRASGELGLHVLEVLDGLLASGRDGVARRLSDLPARPWPLPPRDGTAVGR